MFTLLLHSSEHALISGNKLANVVMNPKLYKTEIGPGCPKSREWTRRFVNSLVYNNIRQKVGSEPTAALQTNVRSVRGATGGSCPVTYTSNHDSAEQIKFVKPKTKSSVIFRSHLNVDKMSVGY